MTTRTGIRADKMRRMAKPPMIKRTYYVPKTLYERFCASREALSLTRRRLNS